jgi:hypothetical protein
MWRYGVRARYEHLNEEIIGLLFLRRGIDQSQVPSPERIAMAKRVGRPSLSYRYEHYDPRM